MRLPEYVASYLLANDVSLRTADDYRWIASYFDRDTNLRLDEFSAQRINAYLVMLKERGWEPPSLRGMRTKLLVLWRSAYREGFTDNQPDSDRIRRIKVQQPNPQGLTHEQTATLVDWCEGNLRRRMRLVPVPAGDYLAALFLFLWSSGMRVGDAISMEYAWIQPTITWRQSKTGRWHRASLSPRTIAAIERIRTERALVWPRPGKSRTALYRLIKRAFAGAGLQGSSRSIRRGHATNVYLSGGDPGQALGHVPGSRVAFRHYVSQEAQLGVVSPTEL